MMDKRKESGNKRWRIRSSVIWLSILFLTACEPGATGDVLTSTYDQVFVKPRPWGLSDTPEGSPLFKKGWEEGCNTGMGVYGGTHYRKPAYKFQQDLSLINNDEYYRAWRDAYAYCRWYAWNWNRESQH